jgi:hypothetical protein
MNHDRSAYYPPRARWYSPFFHFARAMRRRLWLDRLHLPAGLSFRAFIIGLLAPGLAFYVRGEKLIGRAVLIGSLLLAVAFIVWLGYPLANLAFGLLLSAHVSSILFLCRPWLQDVRFRFQIAFGLAVLLAVGGGVYTSLRNSIQERYLMPLRINGRVVVVQTFSASKAVRRGDWITYSLPGGAGTGVLVQEGLSLGPVLAAGGDHLRFSPKAFEVNGVQRPLLPHMPTSGDLLVPENHWFIWPELGISGHGNVAEANISATMLQLANVSKARFIGKPFKRWFWRRQIFS